METAKAALDAGERLDAFAAGLLIGLSPGEPYVTLAIERVEEGASAGGIEPVARHASLALKPQAGQMRDETVARRAVTLLEEEILRRYGPGRGLGSFADDVAVATAMLDAFDVGHDPAHLMMAEELVLGALRQYSAATGVAALAASAEAALILWRLADLTEKPAYHDHARAALGAHVATYRQHGWRAGPFVSALAVIR